MFRKILVGFDGSEGSWSALRAAFTLSQGASGAEILAVSVEERLPRLPEVIDELSEEKDRQNAVFAGLHKEAQDAASVAGVRLECTTVVGHAAQAIARLAREGGFDLVVIGHSGHSGVWGMFLGSTADKVIRHAPCSVLVVR